MDIHFKYPSHLLQAGMKERMIYFKSIFISHREIEGSIKKLSQVINPFSEQSLILLLGPTGVGKSTTALQYVAQQCVDRDFKNGHHCPAIYLELSAPSRGNFSAKSFYSEALLSYGALAINRTLPVIKRGAGNSFLQTPFVELDSRLPKEDALALRFRSYVTQFGTKAIFTDEASNWFAIGKPRSEADRLKQLERQANVIKSTVNKTEATIILIGAEDFAELTLVSGQLIRRSTVVAMHSYKNNRIDRDEFTKAAIGLLSHLPIRWNFDLDTAIKELFDQSCGCVGIVNDKLLSSMHIALQRDSPITIDTLRTTYFSDRALIELREQIDNAESVIESITTTSARDHRNRRKNSSSNGTDHKRKPGECDPSHRSDAAKHWGDPT